MKRGYEYARAEMYEHQLDKHVSLVISLKDFEV